MNPSLTWFSYQHWSPALFLVWWCRSFFSCYLWNICLLLQIIFLPQSFHVMQICWNIFLVEKQTVNIFLTLKYPSSEPWKWSFHSDAPVHHHKNWTMCSYQTQVILDCLWISKYFAFIMQTRVGLDFVTILSRILKQFIILIKESDFNLNQFVLAM